MFCSRRYVAGWVCAVMVCFLPAAGNAAPDNVSLELGFGFSTGDYGTDTTTDSYQVSLIAGYGVTERLFVQAKVPYIYLSSGATVVSGDIQFKKVGQGQANAMGGGGDSINEESSGNGSGQASGAGSRGLSVQKTANGPGTGGVGGSSPEEEISGESQNGLGDITLSADYIFLESADRSFMTSLFADLRLPTGDEDKGLGTGEVGVGVGLSASRWIGGWRVYVEGSRFMPGDNDDFGLKDYWTAEAGVGYLIKSRYMTTLSMWAATKPSDSSGDLLEVELDFDVYGRKNGGISLYVLAGLREDSPDVGGGGSLFWNF